jgi:hypothetical protein
VKLNELIAAKRGASNRLLNVEDISEEELRALHGHYTKLAALARHEATLLRSHSIDEAEGRHKEKKAPVRPSP